MGKGARELYIIGAGGFGREVADTVRRINAAAVGGDGDLYAGAASESGSGAGAASGYGIKLDTGPVFRIAGFVDDDASKKGAIMNDIEVKGGVDWLVSYAETQSRLAGAIEGGDARDARPRAVIAVGDPAVKKALAERLDGAVRWATVIHPSAVISPYAHIGAGGIIQPHAFISSNVTTGRHCSVNCLSSIGHDAVLGDYVSVMSHCDITGGDVLEDGVYIATSVAIIPGVTVGAGAFVGAGSVVLRNVRAGARVLGYPARSKDPGRRE